MNTRARTIKNILILIFFLALILFNGVFNGVSFLRAKAENIDFIFSQNNDKKAPQISINFTLKKKADLKDLENILKFTQGVVYLDKEITPLDVVNKSDVYITRLRKDNSFKNTFNMFVISDNLRKGASQNAVQVLEKLLAL